MNFLTITGNLGKDAVKRTTSDGTSVLSFSVADNQGKDKPTLWWECSFFGKRADILQQYLVKGQQVTVVGQVSEREYQTQDGTQKKAFSVRVVDVALQGGKRGDEGTSYAPQQEKPAQQKPAAKPMTAGDDLDGDIPF